MTMPVSSSTETREWNSEFDFWKFIASLSIVLVHTRVFYGGERLVFGNGHYAVELFFLLTGFFFAKSVHQDNRPFFTETIGSETWQFLWRKIKTFLPFYLFGYLCTLAVAVFRFPLGRFVRCTLPGVPLDMLLLGETGVPVPYLQVINWYLSSMLVVLFFLYPLFRLAKGLLSEWLAPVLALLLLGMLFTKFGTCAPHVQDRLALLPACLFRATSEILLGMFANRVSEKLRKSAPDLSRRSRILLSILGSFAPVAAFALIGLSQPDRNMATILMFFFLFISFSGAGLSIVRTRLPIATSRWLARFGLALFLTHTPVRFALRELARSVPALHRIIAGRDCASIGGMLVIYLSASAALALLCMAVCDKLVQQSQHRI